LHDKVLSLIEDGITKMVIDLKFITWMGSLGIGALMRCLMTIGRADGDLRLSGLSEKVKKLFSITKLIGIIQIYETENEAVQSFNSK